MSKINSLSYFKGTLSKYAGSISRFYRSRYFKSVIIAYAVIMLPLIHMSYKNYEKMKAGLGVVEEDINPMVKVIKVSRKDFSDKLSIIGTVKGASEVRLKFEISGRVLSFNFREGQNVRKGEVIVSLDSEDTITKLEHARAKLDSATSQWHAAQEQYSVHKDLYSMGAIIRAKLREVELNVRGLEAEVNRARAEVRMAQSELDKTAVTAPTDGIMGTRFVEPGDFVTPHDEIGGFIEVESVFVEAGIIERDIQKIKQGQSVMITFDAYPEKVFPGFIDNVSRMVRGETRTLPIQIKIYNPDLMLYSGMLANCEIVLKELRNVIMLPTESIIDVGDMKVVPLILMESENTGVAELRMVQTGYVRDDLTEIVDGLRLGDLVVSETQQSIRDGLRVTVIEVSETSPG